jgi:signal recognition particle subunit SRP54
MIGILTEKLTSTLSRLFGKNTKTDRAQILSELTNTLLDSDVPRTIAEQFIIEIEKELSTERKGSLSEKEWVISTLYKQLVHFLTAPEKISFNAPGRILMIGTQGGGKTTTVVKLGHHLAIKHRVLCASVDFQRPAAIDQLEQMSNTGGIDFYRASTESPEAATKEITAHAEKEGYDWLLLDTAGRLDTEEDLIQYSFSMGCLAKHLSL